MVPLFAQNAFLAPPSGVFIDTSDTKNNLEQSRIPSALLSYHLPRAQGASATWCEYISLGQQSACRYFKISICVKFLLFLMCQQSKCNYRMSWYNYLRPPQQSHIFGESSCLVPFDLKSCTCSQALQSCQWLMCFMCVDRKKYLEVKWIWPYRTGGAVWLSCHLGMCCWNSNIND